MLLYLFGVLVMMLAECSVLMDDIEAQGRGNRHSFNSGASSRVQPWGPVKKKVIGALCRARLQSGLSGLCVRGPEQKHDECEGWGVYPTRSMDVRSEGGCSKRACSGAD